MIETFEEFKSEILKAVKECPSDWRKGQSVFNIVDMNYGIARDVQFIDGIDCFYDDSKIEEFILASYIHFYQLNK